MSEKIKFIDFCSGIGGGRLGLELNGFKCIGFSEIDKSAINTYKSFFNTKNELEFGDLVKLEPKNLPNFDLLISGFPCQTFSIVGKRAGLNDEDKGKIIYHLAEILKTKQPKFFILENVKGLVNHDKGNTLKIILKILNKCGYNVKFEVLNTLDFGLAQSRERIYFIGVRQDLDFDIKLKNPKKQSKISDFLSPSKQNLIEKTSQKYQTFLKYLKNKYNCDRVKLDEILQKDDYTILDTRQSDLRFYEDKIPTIRRDRQGILYVYKGEIYSLSALEALKFQGFDKVKNLKSKIDNLKEADILRQCGNAMSVDVIASIAKEIKKAIYG
ncbi:DNA (cytosine-5-)-methyltransferase [Campylobacter majalis]|uniref:DNA (cytosine-5-)-methyltransferase n=1 Tax=Campylobacter majalis TaxID=2790656 RepID=UPI003D696A3B